MTSDQLRRWLKEHPYWALTLCTFAALAPFLAKPFNIDDPLFLWAAQHIVTDPANPYNFTVNWEFRELPMWQLTENPPAACYLTAAGVVFGWSEWGLHLIFLLPAIAVVLGTYRLARLFCARPMYAGFITLFTPVFLVSANTVMCDVSMLAAWVWAVVLWLEGLKDGSIRKLAAAGALIALSEMTKYYGACLIPLLAAYAIAKRQPVKYWGQYLLIPLVVLCIYQYLTAAAYGHSLLYQAVDFASFSTSTVGGTKFKNGLCTLAFTGGCMAPMLFFAPHLLRRQWVATLAAGAALALLIFFDAPLWSGHWGISARMLTWVKLQMVLWVCAGTGILGLTAENVVRRRDAESLLLLLWVFGTMAFAGFCNWTVNARTILPMAPAVAILIAQQLERKQIGLTRGVKASLVLSAMLALMATETDFSTAVAVRECANAVLKKYAGAPGTLWFQGHWGFHYYMAKGGAKVMDFYRQNLQAGDRLAVPANNTNTSPPDSAGAEVVDTLTVPVPGWITLWNADMGAGFYASVLGPLPFAIGPPPPESVSVYVIKPANASTNAR